MHTSAKQHICNLVTPNMVRSLFPFLNYRKPFMKRNHQPLPHGYSRRVGSLQSRPAACSHLFSALSDNKERSFAGFLFIKEPVQLGQLRRVSSQMFLATLNTWRLCFSLLFSRAEGRRSEKGDEMLIVPFLPSFFFSFFFFTEIRGVEVKPQGLSCSLPGYSVLGGESP